ncbi:MAG: NmrA/HSCARG family protein [Gemmatimonadales bacterium]
MQKGNDVIVVTGATGKQGGAVARELLGAGHRVRAMTRHPDGAPARALAKAGAEVVKGDLDDVASLRLVLKRAWGTFAVQNTWEAGVVKEEEQGIRYAEVAKEVGVRHYVYTSVESAHRDTGIPHFDNKWRVEQRVRELGFPSWVILRPAFFMDNFLLPNFKDGIRQGQLAVALEPQTRLQMIAVEDIGRYGKLAFEQPDRLNGRSLNLAGDELTMPEAAAVLTTALGRKIEFVPVPIEEIRKFSGEYAVMLEWFDEVGYGADIEGTAREFGIPPTRLADWAPRQDWD